MKAAIIGAGFRHRLSVMVNWTGNYFTWDRGPRRILWTERPRRCR